MKKFDLIVIGSGAGLSFINLALSHGMKCALIEKSKFGGTCLTRGCIPSKILVQPADAIRQVEKMEKVGLNIGEVRVDWKTLSERMWNKINFSQKMESNFESREGLTIYHGIGEFISNYSLRVKADNGEYLEEIQGDKIIVATGARSFVPPIKGLDDAGYLTSETFYGDGFPDKPWKSLVIVGGGVISAEFAHIFSAYGTKVSIVEMKDRLISSEEEEISESLCKQFIRNDVGVYLNNEVIRIDKYFKKKIVVIRNVNSGDEQRINCDEVLIASGLRSNTDLLKIENTDIAVDEHGWVITNEYLETSQKNIWALGDINGAYQFRHKANYEMFTCIHNIFEAKETKKPVDYSKVPWAIFTHLQIAHVGLTEKEALKKHKKILVGKNFYSSVSKGYAMGYDEGDPDDGFVKLILDPDFRIVGAHIIGTHAAILIQSYVYLMSIGCICTVNGIEGAPDYAINGQESDNLIFNPMTDAMVIHPSLSELTGWVFGKAQWVAGS